MNLIYFCNKSPLQLFNWVLKYASVFWSVFSNKFADPSLHFYPLTPYFLRGRSAGQGDTISAFFIYFSFRDLISSYKSKPEIKELAIFDHCYLYSPYFDDTTFFLQDAISIKHMVDTFFFNPD